LPGTSKVPLALARSHVDLSRFAKVKAGPQAGPQTGGGRTAGRAGNNSRLPWCRTSDGGNVFLSPRTTYPERLSPTPFTAAQLEADVVRGQQVAFDGAANGETSSHLAIRPTVTA